MGREVCCVAPDIHLEETLVRENEKKQKELEEKMKDIPLTADGPQVGDEHTPIDEKLCSVGQRHKWWSSHYAAPNVVRMVLMIA